MRGERDSPGDALAGSTHITGGSAGRAFALSAEDRERLAARLALAVRRARRAGGEVLATISLPLARDVDPSAVVCASRRPGEHWFVFEQPDRGRAAVAALGEAASLQASGCARFASVADSWRALSAAAVAGPADEPAGGGPLAVGGFAFAPDGGGAPHWRGFEPASLTVPEVALTRRERGGELAVAHDAGGAGAPRRRARRAARAPASAALQSFAAQRCRCSTRRRRGASRSSARCRRSTTSRRSRAPPS